MNAYRLIESSTDLDEVLCSLFDAEIYAIDTEFHREHTYFPKVALIQIAWDNKIVLIDPLKVEIGPLHDLLVGPGVAVMHASSQDLEVLRHECGVVPSKIFDTQVAAGFVGLGSPSLATVYERVLGVQVAKAHQLSDWLVRPLSASQLAYAASDVAYLLSTHEVLCGQLLSLGRLEWVLEECAQIREKARVGRDPNDAWRKVKELRSLRGRAQFIGRAVAAWREERAATVDQPVRRIISDTAIAGLAQKPPLNSNEMRMIRGIDDRFAKSDAGSELIEVINTALATPLPKQEARTRPDRTKEMRPAVSLVSALVAQRARDLGIDASFLATRNDIEGFLAGDRSSRIASGWRADLVGGLVQRIAEGDVAIAFDDSGDLVVEERSRNPI